MFDEELKLSPKQYTFIRDSMAKINIAHGSVRSGKTFSSLIRWGEHIANCPDDKLYMIGASQSSIFDNAVKPMKDQIFRGLCTWYPGKHVLNVAGKDVQVIGANDTSAVRRITGGTHSGSYVDEMTILPQNFLDMLYTRLSDPWSKLFGTTNPSSPMHPLKQMIDNADGKFVYALHFELDDNPNLTDDYKKLVRSIHTGLFYRRFILGEWVMAEGAIYDCFDRKFHVVLRPPTAANIYIAAIDYGASNPFALLLIGYNFNSPSTVKIWVEKEWYYDPKKVGRQKSNAEFADAVERELFGYPIRVLYIDPSAVSMKIELKQRKINVKEADNDVQNGIQLVYTFLANNNLAICESAPNLIREIEGYVWDTKQTERGWDEPVKANDHACDALRYGLYTHFGQNPDINPRAVKDPFANPQTPLGWGYQQFNGAQGGGQPPPTMPTGGRR